MNPGKVPSASAGSSVTRDRSGSPSVRSSHPLARFRLGSDSRSIVPRWLLLLVLMASATGQAEGALQLPPYRKATLPNGLTLLLMEQHEVPLVSFAVLVRAGATADPIGKEGLAAMTAGLLHRGTSTRTADQIAAELDFVGGTLQFGADEDLTFGSAEFLKKDLAVGLDLVADVLRRPAFPETEFAKLVAQQIDGLKQEKDEPQTVIQKYYHAFLLDRKSVV